MRILIVSQYYKPEDAKIPNGLAVELANRGHSVRVVTGFPNYPQGKLFSGYKQRLRRVEREGNIVVRRVPLFVSHSQNPLGRIANYLSFGWSSLLASGLAREADVVYVYATQMTAAIGPRIWRKIYGVPYVLHIQDLWPESVTGSSLIGNKVALRFIEVVLNRWLKSMYAHAAEVIAIAPTMKKMLVERGAAAESTHVVFNWADEPTIRPRQQGGRSASELTVTYAGTLGHMQELEVAIHAAALVEDLAGFRLVIVGSGVAEMHLREIGAAAKNVEFRGRVPIDEMDAIYAESDFQLVTLKDLPIFQGTIPSKLQGSFASGVPVICAVTGDTNLLVETIGAGLSSPAGSAVALAMSFRRAYDLSMQERVEMGRVAREFYLESMSTSTGVDQIENILSSASDRRALSQQ